jgi:hypothetical protein
VPETTKPVHLKPAFLFLLKIFIHYRRRSVFGIAIKVVFNEKNGNEGSLATPGASRFDRFFGGPGRLGVGFGDELGTVGSSV